MCGDYKLNPPEPSDLEVFAEGWIERHQEELEEAYPNFNEDWDGFEEFCFQQAEKAYNQELEDAADQKAEDYFSRMNECYVY